VYHVDYRDRWRFDESGRRRLTLRRLRVLLTYLTPDSATSIALGGSGWRLEHYLAAHLFHATAGKPHPMLPKAEKAPTPEREMKVREAKARKRERERALAAGEIT
jgi:hypothetical protein